ncbi:Hsp70 family protein [Nocardia cyriacigeorgica]|uniref:Hsp70 family protein n=1 Tax=Nocardia cyriacigeorgica TaxID=135487 RepID=A0A6P1DE74_9NOCA|nr:Hsp70 family protein [Nocardia cyriacigeorgica]NEW39132.1 Hsp70 family protein [Nocardia cyriacigeorgica]NEW47090.1 Hsp70 family protein [Nocardia cyriacigeorgica]NEW53459.1 Hsp70 family protein [Nocardia cyriacigeorgica]NEW57942.1 Hsp70 family protein [Nocardia cyriacigeorgica]
MRTSLGISAGNEVVCSALVATATNGAQSFDYRVVSAEAHSDLGDLVASSIELMTTQLPATHPHDTGAAGTRYAGTHAYNLDAALSRPPTAVAVAYRSKAQAQAIRSATGKQHDLQLVPEATAALAYLRHTGLVDRYRTVALVDVGASGVTVTVATQADGTILHSARTTTVSGNAIDELIYHHLVDAHYARRGTRPNRSMLTNRGRAAKEHLSIAPAVTIDHVAGRPLKLTRTDFEELIADQLRELAAFTAVTFGRAPERPEAVAVIGGGANVPSVVDTLQHELDMPVLTVPDPDAVIAKGAALVADDAQPAAGPVAALGSDAPVGTFTKVVGTLAGAIVVVGLVIGYGVKALAPTSGEEVSPAGTTSSTQLPPPMTSYPPPVPGSATTGGVRETPPIRPTDTTVAPSSPDEVPTTTGVTPTTPHTSSSQPTLRPDPNLPQIPFPELPELLGPLFPPTTTPPSGSGAAPDNAREGDPDSEPTTSGTPTPGAAPSTSRPSSSPAQGRNPVPRVGTGSSDGTSLAPTD